MSTSLEQLCVALLFLVPGFIETSVRRAFRPREFSSDLERIVSSLIFSLVLNSFAFLCLLLAFRVEIGEFSNKLAGIHTPWLALYVIVLYGTSAAIGMVRGMFASLDMRALLNRVGLTKFSDARAVWDDVFSKHVPDGRKAPWIRIRQSGQTAAFGRLRNSSALVDRDKPIELFLMPVYRDGAGGLTRINDSAGREAGLYFRLRPDDAVEFLFMEDSWLP
jgi:hypothetical protein